MTGMLASVNSLEEALLVLEAGVDIIDLKQPAQGALGALDCNSVAEIVNAINEKKPISATIGDLPMHPETVFNAAKRMAITGVDYIKIGFFPGGSWSGTISQLAELSQRGHNLIAVLFADQPLDLSIIRQLKHAKFSGVMLDTMNKQSGSLATILSLIEINNFTSLAHSNQLLCGLAGSLKTQDIPDLLTLEPDYLGFRGALCKQHLRTAKLDFQAISKIKSSLEKR